MNRVYPVLAFAVNERTINWPFIKLEDGQSLVCGSLSVVMALRTIFVHACKWQALQTSSSPAKKDQKNKKTQDPATIS